MSPENYFDQIRGVQAQDEHTLVKYMGSYRTKDVDEYIKKLQDRIRKVEEMYSERYEELRTSFISVTRERDVLINKVKLLEQKMGDMPIYIDAYLSEKGKTAVSAELYDLIQSFSAEELHDLKDAKEKMETLQREFLEQVGKLKQARAALDAMPDTSDIMAQLKTQARAQNEKIEQLTAALNAQTTRAEQAQEELGQLKMQSQSRAAQTDEQRSTYQAIEAECRLTNDLNQQLLRKNEQLKMEADRERQLWDAERDAFIQRMRNILGSQKQYAQNLRQSASALARYMEDIDGIDFSNIREIQKK